MRYIWHVLILLLLVLSPMVSGCGRQMNQESADEQIEREDAEGEDEGEREDADEDDEEGEDEDE